MCNSPNCSHDLDDDLSDLLGDAETFARDVLAPSKVTSTVTFEEKCRDCRGTGTFYSYSGRPVGPCFKCKGAGVRRYKQSSEQREKAREAAAAKRLQQAATAADQAAAWLEANPAEADWLRECAPKFEFAQSMLEALLKYGHFTEKQEAAVRSATAKSAARKAQWAAERAERDANKASIDVSRIALAFDTAKANGLKWPKLRLADFVFKPASKHPGTIYVTNHGDVYLGKVAAGLFTRSRDCTAELEVAIVAAAGDPYAAAVATGHQTGICACCGRELTNAESVALGIGPICRDKWGF